MPAPKKIPLRRCVGCGESKPKNELVRVVLSPTGEITFDRTGRKNGRGAYICNDVNCLKKARRGNRLTKSLGCEVSDEIYEELEADLKS